MKRIGGYRKKTRHKLHKHFKQKGKVSITKFMRVFNKGDQVLLKAEPAYHKGMYHQRFHGLFGTVVCAQGDCYKVKIKDQDKEKDLIVHPVHLVRGKIVEKVKVK